MCSGLQYLFVFIHMDFYLDIWKFVFAWLADWPYYRNKGLYSRRSVIVNSEVQN